MYIKHKPITKKPQITMYLTMYLSKKLYFMVLSDRGRETERPFTIQTIIMISTNTIKTITGAKKYCIF